MRTEIERERERERVGGKEIRSVNQLRFARQISVRALVERVHPEGRRVGREMILYKQRVFLEVQDILVSRKPNRTSR